MARLLRLAGHLCRLGLAWVFLLAGVLKALDPEGFVQEVGQYGILPGVLTRAFAYLLIPLEVAAGVALLLNFRPVVSLSVAAVMMLMFIGAVGYAIATDQPVTDCGCFGANMPRTPQETLKEDIGFLAAALFGMFALRGGRRRGVEPEAAVPLRGLGWKGAAIAGVTLASGAFVIASPHLPLDDFATALKPGVRWESLHVALAEADLGKGRHLVALMGLREPATIESLDRLNRIAAEGKVPVIGLYADDDAAYNEFFWTRGPSFPLYHATSSDLRRLHRRLPRFFTVKEGVVTATWPEPPSNEEIIRALE